MALEPRELLREGDTTGPKLPVDAVRIHPGQMGPVSGGAELPLLTPLTYIAAQNMWKVWSADDGGDPAAPESIDGFLWPDVTTLADSGDSGEDVIVQVMRQGTLRAGDVPVPTGETQNNLTAALRVLNGKGLILVQGLPVTSL